MEAEVTAAFVIAAARCCAFASLRVLWSCVWTGASLKALVTPDHSVYLVTSLCLPVCLSVCLPSRTLSVCLSLSVLAPRRPFALSSLPQYTSDIRYIAWHDLLAAHLDLACQRYLFCRFIITPPLHF